MAKRRTEQPRERERAGREAQIKAAVAYRMTLKALEVTPGTAAALMDLALSYRRALAAAEALKDREARTAARVQRVELRRALLAREALEALLGLPDSVLVYHQTATAALRKWEEPAARETAEQRAKRAAVLLVKVQQAAAEVEDGAE